MSGWCDPYRSRSRVRVGCNLSEEFSVKVGIHQGSCLSPLLLIMVLEALSQVFHTGCQWKNLYADDLVIITESLEELQQKLILWNTNMEGNWLRVNMGNTKVLISGLWLDVLQKSGNDPRGMCLKGVSTNSIFCGGCFSWIHKKCSGILVALKSDASLRCKWCTGQARPIDGRLWQRSQRVGRSLRLCHPSVTSGTAYPQVAVVNSLLSHGENSMSSCPSSPPAHFPSPAEVEFTVHASEVPCSMQVKPGPQPYLTT